MSLRRLLCITIIYLASDGLLTKWVFCATSTLNETEYFEGTVDSPCESGQVMNGSECINVTQCTKPVLSDGQCLERCPDGYLYFTMYSKFNDDLFKPGKYHYTIADIKDNPCVKKSGIWLALGSTTVAIIIYCLLAWMFLSTRQYSSRDLKSWCVRLRQRIFQHGSERELLINADTSDKDETDDDFIQA